MQRERERETGYTKQNKREEEGRERNFEGTSSGYSSTLFAPVLAGQTLGYLNEILRGRNVFDLTPATSFFSENVTLL